MSNSKYENYRLIHAVRRGDLERTRELINGYGLSYCAEWSNGYVLLRDAAKYNHTSIAELLLRSGSKVNIPSSRIEPTNTPLHFAALNGNTEIVKLLLDEGANINAINDYGNTPLYSAVDQNIITTVELLLKHGADVNAANKYKDTPLHKAVDNNEIEIAELLLRNGAKVNVAIEYNKIPFWHAIGMKGSQLRELHSSYETSSGVKLTAGWQNGYTPLHLAVEKYSVKITSLLLRKGAKVDVKGTDNSTPLHIAAQKGYTNITEVLLNHGACVHSVTEEGYTPLHFASLQRNNDTVNLLLSKGALVNAASKSGLTPLHIATSEGNEGVVKLLLQNGAKVDVEDKDGKTVLYQAVKRGNMKIVEEVLKYCPDINNQSNRNSLKIAILSKSELDDISVKLIKYGFTVSPEEVNNIQLLHIVVKKGYLKIVEDILKNGADVNTLHDSKFSNINGFSLLHRAVREKHEEVAKLLISYGADVNAKDKTKKTPLFYAIKNLDLKITNLLLKNGASIKSNTELLNISVKKGCVEIVEALLQHGADVNVKDDYGKTALHYAASIEQVIFVYHSRSLLTDIEINRKVEVVKMLLRNGADVNAQTNAGVTTLQFAILNGYTNVVKVLLEYNANVNVVDKNNQTLLHLSAEKGFPEICTMLLDKGVYVDSKSKDGSTALITAINKGHHEVVKVLLERSAEVNYKVEKNLTPLHLAAENGHSEIIEDILTFGADVNSKDKDGRTALYLASLKGHVEASETLLRFGADINITCKQNKTPLTLVMNKFQSIGYAYDNYYYLIVDYFNEHIHKMKTVNMYVSEENEIKIFKEDERPFVFFYKPEMLVLRSQKVADSNITFYDVLAKSTNSLALSLRNHNIVQVLKSNNYKKEFPNYAILIESNYRKAMEIRGLLDQLDNCHLFNKCPELPYICTEKILSYLSNTDLRLLLEAYNPLL